MRRVIGPIVTTGISLVAAGVVVANPIVTPRSDVQIPAVQLSAGSDPSGAGMLDQAFLDAIAPAPPESTNPFAVLKQLISSLAADATYLGKNVLVDAFVAGVTAVSEPELTAASFPYFAPPAGLAGAPHVADLGALIPGLDEAVPALDLRSIPAGASEFINDTLHHVVSSLVADAHYVSGELIAAAYAAGAVVASEPGLIRDTLTALARGDIQGALQNAVKVVTAPLGPTAMIVDAFRTVVVNHLAQLPAFSVVVPDPALTPASATSLLATVTVSQANTSAERSTRRNRAQDADPAGAPVAPAAALPRPAAAVNPSTGRDVVISDPAGGIAPSDTSAAAVPDVVPDFAPDVAPRKAVGAAREAAASAGPRGRGVGKAASTRARSGDAGAGAN